jgi:hypothetical protein
MLIHTQPMFIHPYPYHPHNILLHPL